MFRLTSRSAGLVAAALLLGAGALSAQAQDVRSYILATATTGGTYYPVGVALATLVKVKLEPTESISMSAISSAGSGENVKLMREDQAQFGILQALFGAWPTNVSTVAPACQNVRTRPSSKLAAMQRRREIRWATAREWETIFT
jgi:TRAP-type uncharacterized transport system substrate-binding protein